MWSWKFTHEWNITNYVFDCASGWNIKYILSRHWFNSLQLWWCWSNCKKDFKKKENGLDWVGGNLCNFHVDFPKKEPKDVYYIEGLFLCKKSYFDMLEDVDGNGKEHKIHDGLARMKGFPASCIEYVLCKNVSIRWLYKVVWK